MAKQTVDIPLLGIDRRPTQRQSVAGLCKEIANMQPAGPIDHPYWIAEPDVDRLRNDAGNAFSVDDQDLIVRAAWHVRSSVGKYGTGGSLKRLVCLFSDGNLRIIEPNGGGGSDTWTVVETLDLSPSGIIDCTFARLNNMLAVNVTDDGTGVGIYYVVDDLIIDFELPPLPNVIGTYEGVDFYSDTDIENGVYEGLRHGSVYWAYAYRMFDGSIVRQSMPRFLGLERDIDGSSNTLTYKLRFFHDGFRQQGSPANLEFWEDQIESVVMMVGGYKESKPSGNPQFLVDEDLENLLLYEVVSFPFLDVQGKTMEERTLDFMAKAEEISSYPLANIGAENNRLTADTISSYNSRLLLGGTSEDFPLPGLFPFYTVIEHVLYAEDDAGTLKIYVFGDDVELGMVTSSTNLSSIAVDGYDPIEGAPSVAGSDKNNRFTATIDDPSWSITIDLGHFVVTITDSDVPAMDSPIPIGNYSLQGGGRVIRLSVEIETSQGVFERVRLSDVTTGPITFSNQNFILFSGSNFYNGIFAYPDRRAKKLYVWENDGGYILRSVASLSASQTGDFAFIINGVPANGSEFTKSLPSVSVNDRNNYVPNRIQVSETNRPFTFLPERTYYIGNESQKITAFASNTLAISEGQFGQYPLYIFFNSQIWGLEQGPDASIAFDRSSPVSLAHGVANDRQITNVGRLIVFVYKDGIFRLAGSQINDSDEIGQPIGNYPEDDLIDFSVLTLASRQRDGSHELLASSGSEIYVFNTRFGRWYMINRFRKWFFDLSGQLYSIDSNGEMYDQQAPLDSNVNISFDLDPVHFLQPELLKRMYAVYLRGSTRSHQLQVRFEGDNNMKETTQMAMRIKHQSVFSFGISLSGQMKPGTDYIEAISAQIEGRYPQRTRISKSIDV